MWSYSRVVFFCVLLALAIVAVGCQRGPTWNLTAVEGTVTKAGRPLSNIEVIFLADSEAGTVGPRATSITDEAGHFQLRTDHGDSGTVVGKHRVCIIDLQAKPETPMDKRRVPLSYARFNETLLRVEVQPGSQVIDLDIKGADIEVRLMGATGK